MSDTQRDAHRDAPASSEENVAVDGSQSSAASSGFKFSETPSLEEIRATVGQFVRDRNWEQFHQPRNLVLALVGEVGELSECFMWKGEVAKGLPGWTDREREHLGEEMADVFIYLIRLAEQCGVDLPAAVERKVGLNAQKYPIDKAYGSVKKYSEL
eukprot:Opistho-2@85905